MMQQEKKMFLNNKEPTALSKVCCTVLEKNGDSLGNWLTVSCIVFYTTKTVQVLNERR